MLRLNAGGLLAGLAMAAAVVLAPLRMAHAEPLFTAPAPAWVQPLAVPEADAALLAKADGGVLTLLADEQVQWDGDERLIHTRKVDLIVDETGVAAASKVALQFAADQETLILTSITVTRGEQVLELTDEAVSATLDSDTALARGLADGQSLAEVTIPDLRSGDVVEVAYLRRQLSVVAGINRTGLVKLEQDRPVVLARAIVNWPEDWPIYISGWPARVAFEQTTEPGIIRHIWTRQGHVPTPPEPRAPKGYTDNTIIEFSAFPDWSGVTAALSPHYTGSYPLGPEWDGRLRAIQAAGPTDGDRVIAALRAVQDELGHVPRDMAADRWLARLPADVAMAGQGDAKDKALLLRAMLDKMGIEAYVALTSREQSHSLPDRKPAFQAFDHALVKAMVDGLPMWMDPSAQYEGGDFYNAVTPDFAFALPLSGADQQQIEPIEQGYNSGWTTYVDEAYDFNLLGVYLVVTTSHYGQAANAFRQERAKAGGLADGGSFASFAARYSGLRQLAAPEVYDDTFNNSVVITERYFLPITSMTGAAEKVLMLQMPNPLADVPRPGGAARSAPLDLGRLVSHTHRVNITNAPVELEPPYGATAYNDAFGFAFSGYVADTRALTLEWTYTQYLREVPAVSAGQIMQDAAVVAENSTFAVDLGP
jgi:hypothetical protein